MAAMVFRQQAGQIQPAKRGNAANAQAAANFSGGSRHFVLQPLRGFAHLAGVLDESLPGRSQRDLARRPFEQPGANSCSSRAIWWLNADCTVCSARRHG
jgi:hypothetical protein